MVGTLISRRWNNNGHVSPKDGGPAGKPVAPWPLIFIKFFQMKMPSHIHALMLVFAGFVAFGCSQGTTMTIEGSIDRRYDGQTIFLVPQPYPTLETVDSTKVRKGRFRFTADASTVRMCDVTISNKARAPFVQRLLVAVEPGTLNVRLDTVSSACGTPLNAFLQSWKEALQRGEDVESATMDIIRNNPNPLGGYLYYMHDRAMSESQKRELDSLGINTFRPDVSR